MLHSIAGMPLRGRRLVELGRTTVNLRHGRRLRAAIEAVQPDIVHLDERGMLQAAVIARRTGAAVVMHARSVADPRPTWLVRLSRRIIGRNVDRVIAIDGSVRRSIAPITASEVVYNPLAGVGRPRIRSGRDRCVNGAGACRRPSDLRDRPGAGQGHLGPRVGRRTVAPAD